MPFKLTDDPTSGLELGTSPGRRKDVPMLGDNPEPPLTMATSVMTPSPPLSSCWASGGEIASVAPTTSWRPGT